MSEELIIRHCSPTLAGIKTGSMFRCPIESEKQLRNDIRRLNRRLAGKGIRIIPLRITETGALIYVYRPAKLQTDLSCDDAAGLLRDRGYVCEVPGKCIVRLAGRLRERADFPHEIGLFLGYPPEDVRGFIEKGAHSSKLAGYWKVYGDEEKARRLFAQYKKCTDVYLRRHTGGSSLERLTVAQ